MLLDDKPYTIDRIFRLAVGVAFLVFLVKLLGYLSDVLLPFAVALLLAYLLNPLIRLVQEKLIPHRLLAVLSTLLALGAVLGGAIWLLFPIIAGEMAQSAKLLYGVVNNSDVAARLQEYLPPDIWQAVRGLLDKPDVQEFLRSGDALGVLHGALRRLLPGIWNVVTGTASLLGIVVVVSVIVLYLVFLLLDFEKIAAGWTRYIPRDYRQAIADFTREFEDGMRRFFRGQAMVAGTVGILFALGFALMGLPFGILFGLVLGLMNMVPYLQLLGIPPALFLALVQSVQTGDPFWMVLGQVALVFIVVQSLQDGFLIPRIMGGITGLSPAVILLSLSVWGKLLGLLGLLIAIPVTCLLLAYYNRYLAKREEAPEAPEESP
ncbi:AI-2E family transporter [Desulfohalovibrio reitneri]|uniref:AI-2E family transporter n=1 Tax=Desulfohalovibrio reitneri TaxID=1307759 RepID=UPI0004A745A1|nr:AI-2E family transporter [Desulfohalovibrio reitneri]